MPSQKRIEVVYPCPHPLIGSMHRMRDGYGYGATIPTARNIPTLPMSIPQFRHPPDTPSYTEGMKSKPLRRTGSGADRKNADQMMFQTSGDYGKYLIVKNGNHKTLTKNSMQNSMQSIQKRPSTTSLAVHSSSEQNNRGISTARPGTSINKSDRISNSRQTGLQPIGKPALGETRHPKTLFLETKLALDKTFERHNHFNLMAASMSDRPDWEQRMYGTQNAIEYQKGLLWMRNLRKEPKEK